MRRTKDKAVYAAGKPRGTIVAVKRRGKRIAISVAFIGILVLVEAGWAARDWIREEWYLRRLQIEDDEVRVHAAQALVDMKSVRVVSELIRLIRRSRQEAIFQRRPSGASLCMTPLAYALYRSGSRALSTLAKEQQGHPGFLASLTEAIKDQSITVEVAPYGGHYGVADQRAPMRGGTPYDGVIVEDPASR